jgi:hypothetical protein
MISRYENIPTTTNETNKRVTRFVLYPPIPRDVSDIYLMTTPGDRLDLLAKKYYGDVGYWWIIAEANAIGKGNMAIPVGMQLRVPTQTSQIIRDYENLNR